MEASETLWNSNCHGFHTGLRSRILAQQPDLQHGKFSGQGALYPAGAKACCE
jgi:hypothetical protein